jgi:hypothetical protein
MMMKNWVVNKEVYSNPVGEIFSSGGHPVALQDESQLVIQRRCSSSEISTPTFRWLNGRHEAFGHQGGHKIVKPFHKHFPVFKYIL